MHYSFLFPFSTVLVIRNCPTKALDFHEKLLLPTLLTPTHQAFLRQ